MPNNNTPITIPLNHGLVALIDAEDYELVSPFKWYAKRSGGSTLYAVRTSKDPGDPSPIRMHRLILGVPSDIAVDHVNGNGLDNRRCNIRPCTTQQNAWNRARDGKFSFGSGILRQGEKFAARITIHGFADEKSAADARAYWLQQIRGEFYKAPGITDDQQG